MTNPDYTDITLIWDRSGSMSSMGEEPAGSHDAFVEEQRKTPGKCLVSLLAFDHEREWWYRNLPVAEAPSIKDRYVPRGSTALLDALGTAIAEAGERFAALPEEERPGKVIFVILTDGLENSSHDWTRPQIQLLIETQTRDYGWSFVYLGVDEAAFRAEAGAIGTQSANQAYYTAGVPGAAAAAVRGTSAKVARYRSTGVGGQSLGGG